MIPAKSLTEITELGYLSREQSMNPSLVRDDAIDATTLDTYE
jgi:hypothetical protein